MGPIRFPAGEVVLAGRPFEESIFAEIDRLLNQGYCPDGRLELETEDQRLTCLLHRSLPHLAGLQEGDRYSWVPLKDLPVRAREMSGSVCSLVRTDPIQVLLAAVHFRHRPVLQASTELVDLAHVLEVLEREGQDAVLALERQGSRTLLFLQKGVPARILFGEPKEDPGEGGPRDRFLLHVYAPEAPVGRVEAFKKLNIEPDPDAGTPLARLAEAAKPPPPAAILVRLAGRMVLQRPFMPPSMMIGRDHTCELLLDNLSVSRQHARLSWDRGQFVIEDQGSANGITLNGQKTARTVVGCNDRVGVGKFELSVAEIPETVAPDVTIHMMPKASEIPPRLVGVNLSVSLRQETTLGKAPAADVPVRGFLVRPIHARIRQEGPGAYRLFCTDGATVKLNGRKVDNAIVRPGDEIVVGRTLLRIVASPSTDLGLG